MLGFEKIVWFSWGRVVTDISGDVAAEPEPALPTFDEFCEQHCSFAVLMGLIIFISMFAESLM